MLPQASVIQQNVRYSPRLLVWSLIMGSHTSRGVNGPTMCSGVRETAHILHAKSRGE